MGSGRKSQGLKTETVVLQEGQKSASPKATRQGGERAAGDPVLLAVVDWYGSGVKAVLDSKTHLTFLRTVRAQLEARQVAMDRALRLVPLFRRSRLFELLLMVEYHRTIQ